MEGKDIGTFAKNFTTTMEHVRNFTFYFQDLTFFQPNACEILWVRTQGYAHEGYCQDYYSGLMNSNLLSALKGVMSYYDTALQIHDDYIEAYNKQYEDGNIGNGMNWDPNTVGDGYKFKLYPESHPVLKSGSFPIVQAKVRRIWQAFYYWLSLDPADLIFEEVTKDRQYIRLMTQICLIGFIILSYLMYHLVILKIKAIRALWLDALRILPITCMGEKDTVLLLSQQTILRNIIMNENLRLDITMENKLNFLEQLDVNAIVRVNRGQMELAGYNGLIAIQKTFGLKRTNKGDWI